MAKDELGTKRVCPVTGRKFYDLNKDPIVSPYTGESYPRSMFDPVAGRLSARGVAARAAAAPSSDEEPDIEEASDVEIVPLEEAEEDAGKTVTSEEDIEIEDEALDDDDETFLEEEEEGDDDLSDVIGDVEDDEER
ncbi:TIGR02300 family protein [Blastochloris tepida]|uniref:TIGR02300 family protein n=1 Tax=Blastochloris tepida TaxID=2233851 RepID=A0A348G409_9HYPH|nr:TIGR02300 family protein [Blastochloris tepida]BBF94292.1 TIGR02300 family protein [Blastochloris tepida]